ncbi:MAG: hypothetical protein PHV76_04350 [Bacteroidales bacterium]|nr:hypothetical protein [Bacteroidales bacterium]
MKQQNKNILIIILIIIIGISILFWVNRDNKQEISNDFELNQEELLKEKTLIAVEKANKGDKEGAMVDYLLLIEDNPNDLLLLNNIAVLYSDMNEWKKSEEYYKRLLESYPDFIQGYRMLAYLYQYRFDNGGERALELIERGLIATNNNSDLIRWLVGYYTEIGDEEMRNYYLEMVEE